MLSRSAWGQGQGARSQSSHLETTGRGENPSPCFLHCACPHSRAENALFSGGPTWPRTTQEIPEPFAPRRPGEPLPQPGSPAPPRPAPATYKGSGALVLAEPHRRLWAPPNPRQSHGSVPPLVPLSPTRPGSPDSLSRRSCSSLGRLHLHATCFCRLAPLT